MIEQQGAGLSPPQRLLLREQLALPALAELHAWLMAIRRTVAAGSGTASKAKIGKRFIRRKGKDAQGRFVDPSNNADAFFVIE